MRNIKLVLSYDGTEYRGWQRQPNGRTLQETLEEAIAATTGQMSHAQASGRTDTGVHAIGQVVHFHTETSLATDTLCRALNAHLPDDVVVRAAEEMPADFHANFNVRSKLYRYVFHDGPVLDPFARRYALHSKFRLDAARMHQAAQCLVGTHDFHSFETDWPNRSSSVRTVSRVAVGRTGAWQLWQPKRVEAGELRRNVEAVGQGDFVWLEVQADGFLYNMVRAIAGTLYNVGRGHWPEESVREILSAEDRREAGPTATALGLFLVEVKYE